MSDRTIRIRQPLPLDAAGNIVRAIGAMYPDAKILASSSGPAGDMVIDLGFRTARVGKKRLAADLDEPIDAEASFHGDTLRVFTPREATLALAEWAYVMLTSSEGVANYLEQTVTMPATEERKEQQFCIVACWPKDQTPHALRMAADARADRAEARLRELEAS